MQSKYFGQLDLTIIGDFIKSHPELVKKVEFKKDGRTHQLLNISVLADEQPNQWGKIATIRMDCPKESKKDSDMVFAASLKPSKFGDEQPAPKPQQPQHNWDEPIDQLPF